MYVDPIIAESARKWGYGEDDILHALRNVMFVNPVDDEGLTMIVGPTYSGEPIEVGAISSSDGYVVIVHAMKARLKYMR